MLHNTRPISWIGAARKSFDAFPADAQKVFFSALHIATDGAKADSAKPMSGMGSGVFEIALRHTGSAFRVVYAVRIGEALWVVHAFQKKSTQGIKTPKHEIDLIKQRLKSLRESK